MPHFVKAKTVGPAGHTPFDPDRRTRLPAGAFRPIPRPNDRWARMSREGDVTLIRAEILPAGKLPKGASVDPQGVVMLPGDATRYVREEDIEGYEAPAEKAPAAASPAPAAA